MAGGSVPVPRGGRGRTYDVVQEKSVCARGHAVVARVSARDRERVCARAPEQRQVDWTQVALAACDRRDVQAFLGRSKRGEVLGRRDHAQPRTSARLGWLSRVHGAAQCELVCRPLM
jgi:hypothetical protein